MSATEGTRSCPGDRCDFRVDDHVHILYRDGCAQVYAPDGAMLDPFDFAYTAALLSHQKPPGGKKKRKRRKR